MKNLLSTFSVLGSLASLSRKGYGGLVGLVLIAVSFLHWYLPFTNTNVLLFNLLFYAGNVLFFDFLSYELSGNSPLHSKYRGVRLSLRFLLLGFLFGLILEFYAHWIGKFWYYPYWDLSFYAVVFIPGFAFYAFYLLETYMGTKAVIEHFFIKRRPKDNLADFPKFKNLFTILGFIGSTGIVGLTTFLILKTTIRGITGKIFEPATAIASNITFVPLILIPIFIWLFLEYLEYERHETSMLYETLHGNFSPLAAVFISAWVSALVYEVFNVPSGLWRYANMPWPELTIYHVPMAVYLFWPLHYFPLFSLYRVIFKKETRDLWK